MLGYPQALRIDGNMPCASIDLFINSIRSGKHVRNLIDSVLSYKQILTAIT